MYVRDSFVFFFFYLRSSCFISICNVFLQKITVHMCDTAPVYTWHICSSRQCMYVSLQPPLTYHAICARNGCCSFQFFFLLLFFLFLLFFFFAVDGVQQCEGARDQELVADSLEGAPPLGFYVWYCNRRNFRKRKNFVLYASANFRTLEIFVQRPWCQIQLHTCMVLVCVLNVNRLADFPPKVRNIRN